MQGRAIFSRVPPTLPPFAVPPLRFPFRALAARAARAPLGGERETVLAALMIARLARDAIGEKALSAESRAERAASAKSWLASLAVPARVRPVMVRALEATARSPEEVAAVLADVIRAAGNALDAASREELRAVAASLVVPSR